MGRGFRESAAVARKEQRGGLSRKLGVSEQGCLVIFRLSVCLILGWCGQSNSINGLYSRKLKNLNPIFISKTHAKISLKLLCSYNIYPSSIWGLSGFMSGTVKAHPPWGNMRGSELTVSH